jgi:SAM-dependent methyltransferase
MPSGDEVLSYYPEEYYGQLGTKFQRVIESLVRLAAARHIAFLSRDLPVGARVLDIGCGRGVILGPLADRGFETHGVELRVEAARGVDSRAEVRIAPRLADAAYPQDHFHEVVIWHVLEHLEDPRGTLAEAFRVLQPGGRLVVAVPNFTSLQASWAGAAWFHLDAPRHLFHFPREALLRLLESLGFTIESEHHFSLRQNPFGWVQSGLNRSRRLPRNGLYTLLHERAAGAPAPYSLRMCAWMLVCGLAAAPFALAASVFAAIRQRGATLHVVARKPDHEYSAPA